ncbi:MAG: hypothetical protein HYT08_05355, partial [Candidatus Levybacteria bacterium]|nr:hypothetical protein [Candidatus Levybacteria bacterium]
TLSGTTGGAYLTSGGTLQTTANQTLTLGGDTTGDLILKSRNAIVFKNPGTNNTFVGEGSGHVNPPGTDNTALGYAALTNSTGSFNTSIGAATILTSSGSYNTALGYAALGSVGMSGSNNTAVGYQALKSAASAIGSNNTALGYDAGNTAGGQYNNQNGSNNTYLGYNAGPWTDNASFNNSTAIGAYSLVNASNALVLGGTGFYAVNVGIGTATPSAVLDIQGGQRGGNVALIVNQTGASANDILAASASGATKFRILNSGNASSAAGFTIDGAGSLTTTNAQTLTLGGGDTGDINISLIGSSNLRINGTAGSTLGTASCVTTTNGIVTGSGSCPTGGATWDLINGAYAPSFAGTVDLLLGGTSTASSKFAVLNIASGTPTASISAQNAAASALVLGSDSTIQSVKRQTLTFGGDTTGDITFSPGGTANTLFLQSGGKVGIGKTTPVATLDVNGTASVSTSLTFDSAALPSIQSTNKQTLTIGGDSTGSILFKPGNLSNALFLSSGGNIGVSTTVPSYKLDISDGTANGRGINISQTATSGTNYGIYSSVSGDGTGTNIGAYFSATDGDTANYAAIFDNGSVGVGDTTPDALFTVGETSQFQVDSTGAISTTDTGDALTLSGAGANIAFTGAGLAQITTATAQHLALMPGGNVGINVTAPTATLHVAGAYGGNAAAIINQLNSGDIFTASTSGSTKLVLSNLGKLGIGTISPKAFLEITGDAGNNATLIVNNSTSNGDILAASSSGATKFRVTNSGNASSAAGFTIDTAGSLTSTNRQTLTLGGGDTGDINISLAGSSKLRINGTAGADVSGSCVTTSNGIVTASSDCAGARWDLVSGAYTPAFANTVDLLLGGTTTQSAKFAVLNINSGTPTASIAGNFSLGAGGSIQSTAQRTLTIGGDTTGEIIIKQSNNNLFRAPGGTNTFVGLSSGNTGTNNTALGNAALQNVTGSGNTAIGVSAGTQGVPLTSGSNNTFIGYLSQTSSNSINGSTALGYNAIVGASNRLVLGGTGANYVWAGIGTTTPTALLDLQGGNQGGNAALIINQTGASTNDILAASTSGTTKFRITNGGNLVSVAGAQWLPLTNSSTALQIADAAGSSMLNFDTINRGIYATSSAVSTDAFSIVANSLTSGKGLNVNQTNTYTGTSNANISGNLASLSRNYTLNTSTQTIAYDNSTTLAEQTGSSANFSHTTGTGDNRILIVTVSRAGNAGISSITYNGSALTLIPGCTFSPGTEAIDMYYLLNPSSGSNTVSITLGNSETWVALATTYSGVSQTSPFRATCQTETGSGTSPSLNVTSQSGDVVIDSMLNAGINPTLSLPGGSNQTQRWNQTYGSTVYVAAYSEESATGASTNMAWTAGGTDLSWYHLGVALVPGVGTADLTGSLASITSNCTVTAGICNDSSNLLSLNQSYGLSTGAVLNIATSGLGPMLNISGASGGKAAAIINQTGNNDIFTASKSGTTKFVINKLGKVGIGNSTPLGLFDLSGNNGQNALMILNQTGTNANDYVLAASSSGVTKFVINNLGRVGVGNTSPLGLLDLSGNNGHNALMILNQTGTNTNDYILSASSSGSTKFVINNIGRVGIGNTSPIGLLDISGISGNNAALRVNQTDLSPNADIFTASKSGSTVFTINNWGSVFATSSATTGDAFSIAANSLTTGKGLNVLSTSANLTSANLINGDHTATYTAINTDSGNLLNLNRNLSINTSVYDSSVISSWTLTNTTITNSHTLGAGSNRMVVIAIAYQNANSETINTVTYGGSSATRVCSQATNGTSVATDIFAIAMGDSSSSGANTTSVNFTNGSGSDRGYVITASYFNINQTVGSAFAGCTSSTGSSTTPNNAITNSLGRTAIDIVASAVSGTLTTTGVNTKRQGGFLNPSVAYSDSTQENPTHSWSNTGSGNWVDNGVSMIPVGSVSLSGSLANLTSNCSITTGGCTDTANVLSLTQSNGLSTGAVLNVTSSGLGSMLNLSGASGGKAAAVINQTSGLDIFTASASGATIFTVTGGSGGDLLVGAAGANVTTNIGGNGILAYGAICADDSLDTADDCIDASRTAGTVYGISSSFTIDDIAENFPTLDDSIEAGDVVSLNYQPKPDTPPDNPFEHDYETEFVQKSSTNSAMLGVISEKPGVLLGGHGQKTDPRSVKEVAVALSGRVPVKVSAENGEIMPGDSLTASSKPGVAMKATKPGMVIGIAIEGYSNSDPDIIGKISVFINLSWRDPRIQIAADGSVTNPYAQFSAEEASQLLGLINPSNDPVSSASSSGTFDLSSDPLFADMQNRVTGLELNTNSLSQRVDQLASESAFLQSMLNGAVLGVSTASNAASLLPDLTNINAESATISGNLMVLGRTTTADLGVTGNIAAGLLSIHGLDSSLNNGDGGASINSIGDLNLQSNGLGGINILSGKVTIDTNGNIKTEGEITAKKVNIDTTASNAASLGSGTLLAGDTSVVVDTAAVTNKSRIFVTATSLTGGQPLVVTNKAAGSGFTVEIERRYSRDIKFDWWIVDER